MTSAFLPVNGFHRIRFWATLWLRARLMPLQVRGRRFEAVLLLARPKGSANYAGLSPSYVSACIRRVTRHPWFMRRNRCLRQGLLGFRILGEAGFRPELHFGVDPVSMNADRLMAHCWVCLDGKQVLSD